MWSLEDFERSTEIISEAWFSARSWIPQVDERRKREPLKKKLRSFENHFTEFLAPRSKNSKESIFENFYVATLDLIPKKYEKWSHRTGLVDKPSDWTSSREYYRYFLIVRSRSWSFLEGEERRKGGWEGGREKKNDRIQVDWETNVEDDELGCQNTYTLPSPPSFAALKEKLVISVAICICTLNFSEKSQFPNTSSDLVPWKKIFFAFFSPHDFFTSVMG